jgi:ribose transport system permease protein
MKEFTLGKKIYTLAMKQKAFVATIALLIMMLFSDTNFYTTFNILDMLNSASTLMVVAFGITLVIIAGGIDLSVGGSLALGGIATIKLMNLGVPIGFAIIGALLVGAIIGVINGYLVVYQKTEPFIITLGMWIFLTGLAMQITSAQPISPTNIQLMMWGNGKALFGIPNLIIVMVIVFVITYVILRYTQFGRNCYAIGGDYEVAEYSGISVKRIKAATYVLSGTLSALAGVMVTAKLNSGSHLFGEQTALNVISAVVVGGVSLAGGVGGIPQAAIGLLFITILQNVMNMQGVSPYLQKLIMGLVIVFIIALDSYIRKLKRETV